MHSWDPPKMWDGSDCYVIGGGPSLSNFDWQRIRGKNTIGCNSAFILGADIIKICIFADFLWWDHIGRDQLPSYGGIVVSCCPRLDQGPDRLPSWLLTIPREDRKNGLSHTRLGFNGNTGSLAINLALLLGARQIFLLGFDMKPGDGGRANWHDVRYEKGATSVYALFKKQMAHVARDLPTMFPGREVINVSDVSELEVFPRVSLVEHFGALVDRGG